MSSFHALDISASGLNAGRARMDVIAQNIANAESVTDGGTPYQRQEVVLVSQSWHAAPPFGPVGPAGGTSAERASGGVRLLGVRTDQSPAQLVYRPEDPAADPAGYVHLPNVNLPMEMVDMVAATRAYEANAAAFKAGRDTVKRTLDIMR